MNDVNSSACKNSAFIVPYMYGELPAADCASFESHLLDCGDCTDQFAEISSARYEVYEWKKLEFEPLSTPHIQIPYDDVPSTASLPWFDKIRAAFAQGWSAPGFAFAAVAIVAMFGAVVFLTRTNENGNFTTANLNVPAMSDRATTPPASDRMAANETDADPVVEPILPGRIRTVPVKQNETKRTRQANATPRRQLLETRTTSAQNVPRPAPSLNDFTEDEDTSLRLAELFDDIETSD